MANDAKNFFDKYQDDAKKRKELAPDLVQGFSGLSGKVMTEGSLTLREKEMVALGIAVAVRCIPCIKLHVKASLAAGATKQDIMEAVSVSVLMAGGPAYTHIAVVTDTLEELGV
jgi:AhpD family alkylhydroperoxidase